MPCYSRVSSSVEFGDGTDAGLLAKALTALGYVVGKAGSAIRFYGHGRNGLYQNGKMTVQGDEELTVDQINEIKRAYSAEVVKSASQRFGWQAKQVNPNQFQVTRRS